MAQPRTWLIENQARFMTLTTAWRTTSGQLSGKGTEAAGRPSSGVDDLWLTQRW